MEREKLRSKLGFKFRWVKGMMAASTVVILLVGLIGFLHTPAGRKLPLGRKLLVMLGINCPIDRALTAEQVESSRRRGVAGLSGNRAAPARPALAGLELGLTSEEDAKRWADARGISCHVQVHGMRFLKCPNASPERWGTHPGRKPAQMLTLAFDPKGRLVAVDIFWRQLDPQEASLLMKESSSRFKQALGEPSEAQGGLDPDNLGGKTMKTAFINYRYRDYLAMLTAANIPWSGGVAVHEQYSFLARAD